MTSSTRALSVLILFSLCAASAACGSSKTPSPKKSIADSKKNNEAKGQAVEKQTAIASHAKTPDSAEKQAADITTASNEIVVDEVTIEGNKYVQSSAIEKRLPFKKGEPFNSEKTADAIHHTYGLGYFKQVQIERADSGKTLVKVAIRVQEKKLLEKIEFVGNKHLSEKKLREKLNVDKLTAVDDEQLARLIIALKKLYKDEHHHAPMITYQLVPNAENPDKVTALFTIKEGVKTRVKRVEFDGVKNVPDYKIRGSIYTRERWLLSFMDDAGKFNPENLDIDKHRVEMVYQDQGYWNAKVTGVDVEESEDKSELSVTFYVKEGDRYSIRYLNAYGDDEVTEKEMLAICPIKEGDPVSRTKLADSITIIKALWGTKGYIHADVYPHKLEPNEETKEMDVAFVIEKGEKFFVNRIDISGNKVTRDKVIRRHIELEEGDLITTTKLEISKMAVESLGYFERDGVAWKIHKVGKNKCDLELTVQEAKTGSFSVNMSYGNDQQESERSMKFGIDLEKRNLFGLGYDAGLKLNATRKHFKSGSVHFYDPYFLDMNVAAFGTAYIRRDEYDQWTGVENTPCVVTKGGQVKTGFYLKEIDKNLQIETEVGIEDIKNKRPVTSTVQYHQKKYQGLLDQKFKAGLLQWFGVSLFKNTRNHTVYPSRGYKLEFSSTFAPPYLKNFSYWRNELEASWYTPLIGVDSLVFTMRGKAGIIFPISNSKIIPYKELYHIGGQDTVRGFTWGGVGPAFKGNNSSLGAQKMLLFNAELLFPLIPDYSMKGHIFYDAGAGWDTPKAGLTPRDIKRNQFRIRHSIGFGLNLVKPFPAKIDWGYKLDRDKKAGESASEFHIAMNAAW